ncbi:MAG TPA: ATP-binding protein [Solirubrobacteraceae bacterium]|jgi:anti-sigma regulatory factor (Ser/Thr protein kinase)
MMPASIQSGRADRRPVLELDLERTSQAPALARAAINGFCEHRDISASAIATLMLLVSEVVTNAVVHPHVDESATITVHAHLERDSVHIEIRDAGTRFTPRPRDPSRVDGGYGLYLVEKAATDWGLRSGPTTTVWFQVARADG